MCALNWRNSFACLSQARLFTLKHSLQDLEHALLGESLWVGQAAIMGCHHMKACKLLLGRSFTELTASPSFPLSLPLNQLLCWSGGLWRYEVLQQESNNWCRKMNSRAVVFYPLSLLPKLDLFIETSQTVQLASRVCYFFNQGFKQNKATSQASNESPPPTLKLNTCWDSHSFPRVVSWLMYFHVIRVIGCCL